MSGVFFYRSFLLILYFPGGARWLLPPLGTLLCHCLAWGREMQADVKLKEPPPMGAPLGSSRRGTAPPGKYKIKRKLRLKSNTWQWQRLRICLNSLLIQEERSFSLLKRILHYTRCTMTESRLKDLALKALHPKRLSELSTEKIIEMFVQANLRKL